MRKLSSEEFKKKSSSALDYAYDEYTDIEEQTERRASNEGFIEEWIEGNPERFKEKGWPWVSDPDDPPGAFSIPIPETKAEGNERRK